MTVATTTLQVFQQKGVREDLSDVIYDISPQETPVYSRASRGTADNVLFEWQTDSLAAAVTTNAKVEGDEITTYDAVVATVRLGNYVQISNKTVSVSRTAQKVTLAGRKSDLARQVAKKGKELKLDIEALLCTNQAAAAGSSSTARKTASLLPFIKTNYDKASDGVVPVYTTLPNDVWTTGTPRALTETILKNVIQQCWTSGASPSIVMVGAANKQIISGFDGVTVLNMNQTAAKQATIIGAADVYVSDFGNLTIIPNRFVRTSEAFVLDFEYIEVAWLDPIGIEPLAKTGDADKRLIVGEFGLKVKNEKALGVATGLGG